MKAFAVVLLCFFASVQGRSTGVQVRTEAALGENPWVVHLRTAVSTSGLLNSCVGTLINNAWVLTSASCVRDVRFIWIRYGTIDVTRPGLVTETNTVRTYPGFHPEAGLHDIALISITRLVESTDTISPVALPAADAEIPSSGKFCGYGADEDGSSPGEILNCYEVTIEESDDGLTLIASSDEGVATQFDSGAALVSDGVQYGMVVGPGADGSAGKFLRVGAYIEFITGEAGLRASDSDFGSDVIVVN